MRERRNASTPYLIYNWEYDKVAYPVLGKYKAHS